MNIKHILAPAIAIALMGAFPATAEDGAPIQQGSISAFQSVLFGTPRQSPSPVHPIIPQGRVAEGMGLTAWYSAPTGRYGHAVLGDAIEGGSLVVKTAGKVAEFILPERLVFEDLEPRIVDMDGDGKAEILTITTSDAAGGGIELYGLRNGGLELLARSNFIGRSYRWLNPAGVADYDGDGENEIAYIETPHIGGKIVLLHWDKGSDRLVEERRTYGYSTHTIGSTVLAMAATLDWNGDGAADLVLPRQDRSVLAVVSMADGQFQELAAFEHPDDVATPVRLVDTDGDGREELLYGLRDGNAWILTPPRP